MFYDLEKFHSKLPNLVAPPTDETAKCLVPCKVLSKQDECDRLTAVAMKQTLGRQVVSTLPVKHILLLQHVHEPPSPESTARPMWLTSGRISHETVYAGRRRPLHAGRRIG